jgi:predicted RNA-binding Zn-ribbon protein involved in translation (DUF1610 family)
MPEEGPVTEDHGQQTTDQGPVKKPPTVTKAPPAGRKFPCKNCGAKLDFDPSVKALKCPYCGHVEQIESSGEVAEHDFEGYLKHHAGANVTITNRSEQVRCTGCGAMILLEDKLATDKCPYCATHLENKPESAEAMIAPESLLPFGMEQRKARTEFEKWIDGLWFAPNELKKLADLGQFSGVYVPFWTYDSMTYSDYTGQRGDDYTTTETYVETDSDGNQHTRTRTVVHTNWTWVSGQVQHFFDDVLICASKSLPLDMVNELTPWDMESLTPFKPDYLSGFKTERYAVGLEDGFNSAKVVMDGAIRQLVQQDIGGDHQQISTVETRHLGVTFKHLLLPIWIASYRYHDQLYQIIVNARTGEVQGRRPYSVWKIASLAITIILAAGAVAYFFARR